MKVTIAKERILSSIRSKGEITVTAIIWLLWIGIIITMGYKAIMKLDSLNTLIGYIRFYGTGLTYITAIIISWSLYNRIRYKRGYTRKMINQRIKVNELDEMGRLFNLEPDTIQEIKRAEHLHVQFREEDYIIDLMESDDPLERTYLDRNRLSVKYNNSQAGYGL